MFLLLTLSGASAIGTQVIWLRYFSIILGNNIQSFSWVSSTLMVGLSLGAFIAIKFFTDSKAKILKKYILIELGFLISSAISFFVIYKLQDQLIVFLTPQSFLKDGLVVLSTLLPSSILMGMTLPILIDFDKNTHQHEKMYGINTIGGSFGVLLFGFIFLKEFGYLNMMFIIPAISLINIILAYKFFPEVKTEPKNKKHSNSIKIKLSTAMAVSALSGFTIFLLETVWFRHLEILIGDRAYISSIILFTIILLLGLSAYLSSYTLKKFNANKVLGLCISLSIACFFLSQFFMPDVFFVKKIIKISTQLKVFFILISFVLPVFLLGFIYPTILKLIQSNFSDKKTAVSLGLNSFFSVCGALTGSYVLIEIFGVNSIFLIASIILLLLLILIEKEFSGKYMYSTISMALVFLFVFTGVKKLHIAPKNMIIHEKQTALTHFSLVKKNNSYEMYTGNYRIIFTYGEKNVNYAQQALAFAPALFHDNPKTMLNIGLGYGITVGSFLHLNPEYIDSVEIIPSVAKMSFLFQDSNNSQHQNPKVNTIIDDGRRFLARTNKKYEIITANISSPYSVGGSFFLTKEYYQKVKEKLTKDGVYSQLIWGMNNPEIFNTLNTVFPYVTAIPGYDLNEIVILASSSPLILKKDINTYNKHWELFLGQPRELSFKLGNDIAQRALKTKPRFIISDDRADMLFQKDENMGFLWTYK